MTIFGLKLMMKSGLEFFILKLNEPLKSLKKTEQLGNSYPMIQRNWSYRWALLFDYKESEVIENTLGDFRNISTIFIFLLAVPPYNFCNVDTKMV